MADAFVEYIKDDILDGFPEYTLDFIDYLSGNLNRTEKTIKTYALDVKCFYDFLILRSSKTDGQLKKYTDITPEYLRTIKLMDITRYLSFLKSGTNRFNKTVSENAVARKRKLSSLRTYMQFLVKNNYLEINIAKLADMPKAPKDKKSPLADDEVVELLDNIAEVNVGTEKQQLYLERSKYRDYAIMSILSQTGIRVSELVNLDIGDIDFRKKEMVVIRKGRKKDIVYLNDEVICAIEDYINNERFDKDDTQPALFLSSRTKKNSRLSVRAVQNLVKKFGRSVTVTNVTPHSLRRTFGTRLYSETNDIFLVSKALGHENLASVNQYVTLSKERQAMIRNLSYHKKDNEN